MEVRYPGKHAARTSIVGAIIGLIATLGCTTSVFGANIKQTDCDAFEKAAEAHASPVDALSINRIDHSTSDADSTAISSLDAESADFDSATPFLYLTPRVASALRNVFATMGEDPQDNQASDEQLFDEQSSGSAADKQKRTPIASSPLAEVDLKELERNSESTQRFDETLPSSSIDRETDLPPLQRQMFRTDI